jgi:hypothetical protein
MDTMRSITHSHKLIVRISAILIILAGTILLTSQALAQPLLTPTLAVDPTSGPAGKVVRIYGTGWTPNPNGVPYEIHWDTKSGSLLGSFSPNANGAFSVEITIPANATEGNHTILACERCNIGPNAPWASTIYDIEPGLPPTLPPAPPPVPTAPPSECDRRGLAGEVVIDFETLGTGSRLDGSTIPPDVKFLGDDTLIVFHPAVETHSGSKALINETGGREFGSINIPIRIGFEHLYDFVGVFVGLNEQVWADVPFTATLTAFGLDESGRRIVVGTDSETLGPEATPIDVCLAVEAPGRIFEVTINYNVEGGVAEPEAIDDLVLRGTTEPVPIPVDDLPPVVEILQPTDGELVTEYYVRVDGQITEDRELARVELWVNDTFYRELGASPAGEANYLFALDAVSASDLHTCGENKLEVRAWDAAGNMGRDVVNFMLRAGDLQIVTAEPVQVLYDAPLIREKGTAFRVRINSTFTCEVTTNFRLDLPDGQWGVGIPTGLAGEVGAPPGWEMPEISEPVILPANATDYEVMLPVISGAMREAAWNPTDNPFGKIGMIRVAPRPIADSVSFGVVIDPQDALPEETEGNNSFTSLPYPVVTTRGVHIVFAGQAWDYDQFLDRTDYADLDAFLERLNEYAAEQMDYLIGTYPVADTKITYQVLDTFYYRETYRDQFLEDPECWDPAIGAEKGCNACFSELMSAMIQSEPSTSGAHAVGLIQPFGCCGCNGAGIAVYLEDDGVIDGNLVHELGHQDIGAWDCYLCTYPDGSCGCSDCGELTCESCTADEGFWVNRWQPYDDTARYYMWCVADPTDIWPRLDDCTTMAGADASAGYRDLIDHLRDVADPEAVVVRGQVTDQGQAVFSPFLRVEQAMIDLSSGSSGEMNIAFLNASGELVDSFGFTPVFLRYLPEPEGAVETDTYRFSFRLPWSDAIASIELRDAAGSLLVSQTVSANPPAVTLLEPNGGERWYRGASKLVHWSGQDPDGDSLSYGLWISNDSGLTWSPLTIDLTTTEFKLETALLQPGDSYLIKVRATDGVQTAEDVSDQVFSLQLERTVPMQTLVVVGIGAAVLVGMVLLITALVQFAKRRSKA